MPATKSNKVISTSLGTQAQKFWQTTQVNITTPRTINSCALSFYTKKLLLPSWNALSHHIIYVHSKNRPIVLVSCEGVLEIRDVQTYVRTTKFVRTDVRRRQDAHNINRSCKDTKVQDTSVLLLYYYNYRAAAIQTISNNRR